MHMGFSLTQKTEIRLTTEQRQELKHQQAQILLELAQAIHDYTYQELADCPDCGHRLSPREILEGFLPSPTDTTTMCPKCQCRFQPLLIAAAGHGSSVQVNFLCPDQALHALTGLGNQTPEMIQRNNASAYQSTLVHFGSLRAAFARLGITYTLEDLQMWKVKVIPFLGQLPDSVIAGIVGVSHTTIGNMRKRCGIPRFRASDHV